MLSCLLQGEGAGSPSDNRNRPGVPSAHACAPHLSYLAALRIRHVADLQEQAASPSDLPIATDLPKMKSARGQTVALGLA